MYYFINGYTSKLAGTEAGVTEPQPGLQPCFGGPFLPRPPMVYAEWLDRRIAENGADVWLLNTGWTGGPYGVGERFSLAWTRTFVDRILDGSSARCETGSIRSSGCTCRPRSKGCRRGARSAKHLGRPDAYDVMARRSPSASARTTRSSTSPMRCVRPARRADSSEQYESHQAQSRLMTQPSAPAGGCRVPGTSDNPPGGSHRMVDRGKLRRQSVHPD